MAEQVYFFSVFFFFFFFFLISICFWFLHLGMIILCTALLYVECSYNSIFKPSLMNCLNPLRWHICTQLGLHSRTRDHHRISNDRAAVKGVACQPSAASGVDHMAAEDLRYRLGLDHLELCKPATRAWNRSGDWKGASVVWPVLVWYGWTCAAWGPDEQHSSEFAEYDSVVYLGCRTRGCCNSRFWTSRRLG